MLDLGSRFLRRDVNRDIRAQAKWAKEEASASGLWGSIGGGAGGLLAGLLLSSTLGPVGMAIAAGLASGGGSMLGSTLGRGTVDDISTKFRRQDLKDIDKQITDAQKAAAIKSAIQSGVMSFASGAGAGGKGPVDPGVTEAAGVTATEQVTALGAGKDLAGVQNIAELESKLAYLQDPNVLSGSDKWFEAIEAQRQLDTMGLIDKSGGLTKQMNIGGQDWDVSMIKDYQAQQLISPEAGTQFLTDYGKTYGEQAIKQSILDQQAATGYRFGLYGREGKSMFDPTYSWGGDSGGQSGLLSYFLGQDD